jgi:hypothetical protein
VARVFPFISSAVLSHLMAASARLQSEMSLPKEEGYPTQKWCKLRSNGSLLQLLLSQLTRIDFMCSLIYRSELDVHPDFLCKED